jgi:hypothetical protein
MEAAFYIDITLYEVSKLNKVGQTINQRLALKLDPRGV